ncbi:hypothetical protein [Haliea sp. E17]|uniref:hypothetical protein n=1 Tax=Haliea sp. E17 TaxID=3401576 RepID=UPI003AADCF4D
MYIKPRRQVLFHRSDRVVVHVGLFVLCLMLGVLGLGLSALWCLVPAAGLVELLSLVSPHGTAWRL